MATTDYMFWTRWTQNDGTHWTPQQYKGETSSYVKTQATQNVNTAQLETRDKHVTSVAESRVAEDTVSSGVEEGAQPALKTFDLNDVLH